MQIKSEYSGREIVIDIPDSEYWIDRAKKRVSAYWSNADNVEKELNKKFLETYKSLEKEFLAFSNKYGKDGVLTYSQKRVVSLMLELKPHIDRLYLDEDKLLTDHLSDSYSDNYVKGMYELTSGTSVAFNFAKIDNRAVQTAITYPWSGESFSDRIYQNKDKLINVLRQEITSSLIRGDSTQQTARVISNRLDISRRDASMLVQTETAAVITSSDKKAYNDFGILQYEYEATLDNRTSPICFVGTDKIKTVSDIQRLFKRDYSGLLVTITTTTGNKITGTPKHPILTSGGWLHIDEIDPSKHVVYSVIGNCYGIVAKQAIDIPSKFSKLFDSFTDIISSSVDIGSSTAEQLNSYGMRRNNVVDVLNADRILRNDVKSIISKKFKKNLLGRCHNSIKLFCIRAFLKRFFTVNVVIDTPEAKIMSFSNVVKPLFTPIESRHNNTRSNTIIKKFNSFNSIISTIFRYFSSFSYWCKSVFLKKCCHSSSGDSVLLCEFSSRNTVPVLAENIVTKTSEFCRNHHVYNLQTSDNVYINNNIIVHNCRELDMQVFDVQDMTSGLNAPPMHPRCRSTTVPHFDYTFSKRISKSIKTGSVEYVPQISYKEWEKRFVE